jgi:glutathione peroxidase
MTTQRSAHGNKAINRLFACFFLFCGISMANAAPSCSPLLSHTFPRLQDEAPQNLCQYQGKVILVVNTASYCGFTSQYEDLEKYMPNTRIEVLLFSAFYQMISVSKSPVATKKLQSFVKIHLT